jgi:T4 RnlA family RNA ligase
VNNYQNNLYNELITLVQSNEAFYYSDFEQDGVFYRIFLYRLASYTDFLAPSALESRGVMFEMETGEEYSAAKRLVSLPFEKFFNYQENPFTADIDWGEAVSVQDKRDGSLMSTYKHFSDPEYPLLMLKSKGSISSPQCLDAMQWLYRPENEEFYSELEDAADWGYTVIMEWTAPDNRIVLGYDKPGLTVLAIRRNEDGSYKDKEDFRSMRMMQKYWVDDYFDYVEKAYGTVEEFVESIPDRQHIEGYVITLADGMRVKMKTMWYLTRHRMKDGINSPRRLFEAVLEEATDDMRTLFFDDPVAMKMIADMEVFGEGLYNHLVDQVERFYERNKDMTRKDYAILGQKELTRPEFGLAMMKYVGKQPDYKESLKKRWRDLGLKEEVQLEEGEE